MANMAYCRFRNTLPDLVDCYRHMEDVGDLSVEEKNARRQLIKTCGDIAKDFGYELEEQSNP